MSNRTLPGLIARKTLGSAVLWGTVGLICLQALYYVSFGPAV